MESFKTHTSRNTEELINLNNRILIVEDDDISYSLMEEVLNAHNINPLRAYDGIEAINIFIENAYTIDLIFMDIRLPKLNGYEATRKIKEINKNTPIIALTAYTHSQCIIDCYDAGCSELITKPYNINKIISLVDTYVINKK
ncbi:MAG: response regulator [Bacteroidales bacterium]|nr:response regulator [Bacteroidales bacterium]